MSCKKDSHQVSNNTNGLLACHDHCTNSPKEERELSSLAAVGRGDTVAVVF
jgi:hypothetical protein